MDNIFVIFNLCHLDTSNSETKFLAKLVRKNQRYQARYKNNFLKIKVFLQFLPQDGALFKLIPKHVKLQYYILIGNKVLSLFSCPIMSDPLSNALKLSNDFQKSRIYADYSQRIYILHYYYPPTRCYVLTKTRPVTTCLI